MGSNKQKLTDSQRAEYAASKKKKRDDENLLRRQWRKIDLTKESFQLSRSDCLKRSHASTFRTASLLKIFLAFVTHSLVTQIASDLDPSDLI